MRSHLRRVNRECRKYRQTVLCLCVGVILCLAGLSGRANELTLDDKFTANDAVLVTRLNSNGTKDETVFAWQIDKPLIPASLTKLVTAKLAIDKWGLDYAFKTDFFIDAHTLWVKGYGDPYLVSEELDLIVLALRDKVAGKRLRAIAIDNHYFEVDRAPGRSNVSDSYNAPVSAVSANFNTVSLRRSSHQNGAEVVSAEPQTPLTKTAQGLAAQLGAQVASKPDRFNLINADNAQRHFAEILGNKLGLKDLDIRIGQQLPKSATLLYQHSNTHSLADVLRGTLSFSNNFIANQVFLSLSAGRDADTRSALTFAQAQRYAQAQMRARFAVAALQSSSITLKDGSGLSRENRLSAEQINAVLSDLSEHKTLLKSYRLGQAYGAQVRAKTGTLDGVRSFAGYISFADTEYQFVFVFNRAVAWRYREQLLERVIKRLET